MIWIQNLMLCASAMTLFLHPHSCPRCSLNRKWFKMLFMWCRLPWFNHSNLPDPRYHKTFKYLQQIMTICYLYDVHSWGQLCCWLCCQIMMHDALIFTTNVSVLVPACTARIIIFLLSVSKFWFLGNKVGNICLWRLCCDNLGGALPWWLGWQDANRWKFAFEWASVRDQGQCRCRASILANQTWDNWWALIGGVLGALPNPCLINQWYPPDYNLITRRGEATQTQTTLTLRFTVTRHPTLSDLKLDKSQRFPSAEEKHSSCGRVCRDEWFWWVCIIRFITALIITVNTAGDQCQCQARVTTGDTGDVSRASSGVMMV